MSNRVRHLLRHLRNKRGNGTGYRLFRPHGRLTPSELVMQARIEGQSARFGIINRFGYAYLVLTDGTLADGLFTQLSDSCSLS
jgi:hypothetical protein